MEQISLFDMPEIVKAEKQSIDVEKIKLVGEQVGRIVLGECRIATITSVEGLPFFPFYRTNSGGCYSYKEGLDDIAELQELAKSNRQNYKTIVPSGLKDCITMEYERKTDGRILWKQVGIFNNMLFWKDWITYQFLEPFDSEKKLKKSYENFKKSMMEDAKRNLNKFRVLENEHEMRRLYMSKHGFYADAEYVAMEG